MQPETQKDDTMQRTMTHAPSAIVAAISVILGSLMLIEPATAHAGHSHSDGGLDVTSLMQIGGTAVALGVAYLLASRIYRRRDASLDTDGDDGAP